MEGRRGREAQGIQTPLMTGKSNGGLERCRRFNKASLAVVSLHCPLCDHS